MELKKYLPNFLTMMNLFCGLLALIHVFNQEFLMVLVLVFLAVVFDFFDGFFARKFNVCGSLGLQLDSLADMVTSGVVPGVVMFVYLKSLLFSQDPLISTEQFSINQLIPYVGFAITLASAFRLAVFNISTDQSDEFIGLPTPANALFIISLPYISRVVEDGVVKSLLVNPWLLVIVCLLSAYLLNSKLRLFSFKFKNGRPNSLQLSFVVSSFVLIIFFRLNALPIIVMGYVFVSFMKFLLGKYFK